VLVYDPQKDKAWKCTLCAHRVDQGLEPFCVLCCEMEAIFFGDISNPSAQISQLAEKRKAYVLRPESGAKPAVRYCSPRVPQR
jgi:Fe-S-cluster-containing dehydrogenase component